MAALYCIANAVPLVNLNIWTNKLNVNQIPVTPSEKPSENTETVSKQMNTPNTQTVHKQAWSCVILNKIIPITIQSTLFQMEYIRRIGAFSHWCYSAVMGCMKIPSFGFDNRIMGLIFPVPVTLGEHDKTENSECIIHSGYPHGIENAAYLVKPSVPDAHTVNIDKPETRNGPYEQNGNDEDAQFVLREKSEIEFNLRREHAKRQKQVSRTESCTIEVEHKDPNSIEHETGKTEIKEPQHQNKIEEENNIYQKSETNSSDNLCTDKNVLMTSKFGTQDPLMPASKTEVQEINDNQTIPTAEFQYEKMINILLMGETGVGKSTFINAFANYLSSSSLEDALGTEPIALIYSKFNVIDKDCKDREVIFGEESENEQSSDACSRTQSCKTYEFPWQDKTLRIIDTPGVGDVRGPDQDKENMTDTMKYISQYSSIHGICFLLKPNESRLTVTMRSCLNQLFKLLHKSASHNIVFVFTNVKSTFYKPGDTFKALENYLNELSTNDPEIKIELETDRYYCVDNEGFRHLLVLKNNIDQGLDEEDWTSIQKSWNISVQQSTRLINYVSKLKPHKVSDSGLVSSAKNLLLSLSKVLAVSTLNIQKQIVQLEEGCDKSAKIEELEEEQDAINRSKVELTFYVNSYGIGGHFDANKAELQVIIKEETMKQGIYFDHQRKRLIERLTEVLNKYAQMYLHRSFKQDNVLTNEIISNILKNLCNLKESGSLIKSFTENNKDLIMCIL